MNEPSASRSVDGSSCLHVGGLSPEVSESALYESFATVGELESVHVVRDLTTREPLGHAYVNFSKAEDAERAIEFVKVIDGRDCQVTRSNRALQQRQQAVRPCSPLVRVCSLRTDFCFPVCACMS